MVQSNINRSNYDETSENLILTSGLIYIIAQVAEKCLKDQKKRFMYLRFSNPTVEIFKKNQHLFRNPRILSQQQPECLQSFACKLLFGSCNQTLTKILPKYGIIAELVDGRRIINLESALSKKTKLVFF